MTDKKKPKWVKIKICMWNACIANFSNYMITRIQRDIEKFELKNIEIEETPCMWMCKKWPNAKVNNDILNYTNWNKLSEAMFKKLKK
jgi:NADH:ubiquinone oxidoreductase subunit E